ncbi:MAG TPA: hypothetical protein VMF35_06045 [Acidimicrobiales bacterium]|nr:hypothetical protein [Acidimicrobiales bacterium]
MSSPLLLSLASVPGTTLPVALVVAALLAWLGVLIAKRVARFDTYSALAKLMIASVLLHLICAPLQIFVVDHFYGGVADWLRYDHQGALLADLWRNGHFTLAGSGVNGIVGNGSVSIAGGVVMTFVGPDQLAAFFVCSWLAFVGTVFFYLAFRATFPRADRRWYAILIFLFPSLLFWTADVSKESFMLFGLGLTAYGIALVMVGQRTGYLYMVLGSALSLVIRPNELVILAVGFAIAMLFRAATGRVSGSLRRPRNAFTMGAVFVFVAAAVIISTYEAAHFLHTITNTGIGNSLNRLSANNQGVGAGFGSSSVTYSSNPLWYPRDVYTILFDPLPFSAHSVTQLFAGGENTLILVVVLVSLPRLRYLPRLCLQRPYVFTALFYSVVFVFAFAALGNLGLITRERTLLLPFLFVVLAFPVARSGAEPYPWQRRRARMYDGPARGGGVWTRGGDDEAIEGEVVTAATVAEWTAAERPRSDESVWGAAEWRADS